MDWKLLTPLDIFRWFTLGLHLLIGTPFLSVPKNHSNKPRTNSSPSNLLLPSISNAGGYFFSSHITSKFQDLQTPKSKAFGWPVIQHWSPKTFGTSCPMGIPVFNQVLENSPPPKKWCQHISVVNFRMILNYCHCRIFLCLASTPIPLKSASVAFFV